MTAPFIHPAALVESDAVGPGTRVWAHAHVMRGAVIGADCNIGDGCFVEAGARIGDGVTVKNGVHVYEGVTLEDGVFVGPGVVFTNDRFPRSARMVHAAGRYAGKGWLEPVRVERGATLGAATVVLPGVTVGAFAMTAAASVVTRDVLAHALVMGAPARWRGWVCRCGLPLAAGAEGWQCAGCGGRYMLTDGGGMAEVGGGRTNECR